MKQETIDTAVAQYNFTDAKIAEVKDQYLGLVVKDPQDTENYLKCKEAHQEVKKYLSNVEAKRKDLNADALKFTRGVNGRATEIKEELDLVKDHLQAQRKVVEDEKQRYLDKKAKEREDEEARIKKEEEDRLADQKKDQDKIAKDQAEAQKKIDDANAKIEADKEANRVEEERLAKVKTDAEEAKKKAIQDEKDRKEAEERHKKEVKEAEEKAKKQAIEDERLKVEAEKKEKAEAEAEKKRLADLAPDQEKLKVFGLGIAGIEMPDFKSEEAFRFADDIYAELQDLSNRILTKKL